MSALTLRPRSRSPRRSSGLRSTTARSAALTIAASNTYRGCAARLTRASRFVISVADVLRCGWREENDADGRSDAFRLIKPTARLRPRPPVRTAERSAAGRRLRRFDRRELPDWRAGRGGLLAVGWDGQCHVAVETDDVASHRKQAATAEIAEFETSHARKSFSKEVGETVGKDYKNSVILFLFNYL